MYQRDLRQGKLLNYIYLGGSLIAIADQGLWGGALTAKRYQHTDALGTPVAVTDENRNVIERSEYEPYGLLLNRAQHDGPGFTGHVQDALTGLTYMQQRYYDPMIGRFLSVDPVTAYSNPVGAFNRYDYAANNPYRFTDPDGRKKIESKITKDWSSLGAHSSNGLTVPSNQLSKADRSPRVNPSSQRTAYRSESNSCDVDEGEKDDHEQARNAGSAFADEYVELVKEGVISPKAGKLLLGILGRGLSAGNSAYDLGKLASGIEGITFSDARNDIDFYMQDGRYGPTGRSYQGSLIPWGDFDWSSFDPGTNNSRAQIWINFVKGASSSGAEK